MVLHSEHSKKAYLSALKGNMSGHFDFGSERFTGFFIGSFFYITYHSGYEWNRRITNQKNAALGFVKKAEDGCDAHFLRFKGLLCPLVFLPTYLVVIFASILTNAPTGFGDPVFMRTCFLITLVVMAIAAPLYTLMEACTDASIEGHSILLSLLTDPVDAYGNLDLFS